VQLGFASGVHQRFLQAAPEVVFSWPRRDGERELQPSPLLAGLPPAEREFIVPVPSLEVLRQDAAESLEWLIDARAPAVAAVEDARHLKGGTALLKAQAICPASAFYQFRLGAGALEAPVDGLDPRARGSLLHLVFEHFWRGRDSAGLREMADDLRRAAIDAAVEAGLAEFEQGSDGGSGNGPLPARFRAIEAARLRRLLGAWLNLDLSRGEDFRVVACEEKHLLCLDGIEATVVIDRIDELVGIAGRDDLPGDGKRLVIDYKTGARVDARSWAAVRITEPQLPIYAAFAVNPHPLAGAAFAQVRSDKMGFVGITETAGLLPKVKSLAESRRRFPESVFADWDSLIRHWRQSLLAFAGEIRAGDARVVFADERDLALSPVLPLLRLAERRWQYERLSRGNAVAATGAARASDHAGIEVESASERATNPAREQA
ncbi:MAG TPA: PD-(D/E)XK nuclease family protein, partial [Rhodocyclaceae bacterium]|nr:PD-(D/E)XK nuclease family protein [Rhodocyclaceae bacterium]